MEKKEAYIADLGGKLVAVKGGTEGGQIEINDAEEIKKLRDLIALRKKIGVDISKHLIGKGLVAASEEEPTKIISH